ncbi:MAG: hypothetical protein COU35_01045 [Candidatus Magasanikbacteria bacterium CG10_big_fil_rev_8_21_14_0_10_47_10]|uniref:Peptidase M48 domain-containing protein n=1 Tax=Candidatus Magasanikbacteria bacterium CG10_big_fil_rev_8_21_14_0_10_47_10 TaxID=1974652 RepID=A0A2H0TRG5_9BACT|nr:MAG: hypothetical protein COU35_01045 [Candidatus Magasanikbacteria bacterium CG10_big_fil_rev_8_21_14_0_10_47_10]
MSVGFSEAQRESTKEYARRQRGDIWFPMRDIKQALFRTHTDNKEAWLLAEALAGGNTSILPESVVGEDENGRPAVKIDSIAQRGMKPFQALREIKGAVALFEALDRDKTLAGEDSVEVRRFVAERKKVSERVREEVVEHLHTFVDYEYELANETSGHSFESVEAFEAYTEIQDMCQRVTESLFRAAGMNAYRPKVHLTRSLQQNAFVWSEKPDVGMKEYITDAPSTQNPQELPIYIHYGLVSHLPNEDALAAVLGHEFSHLLQPTFVGNTKPDERQRLEYDADATGMRLADSAGYNPRAMIDLFKGLVEQGGSSFFSKFGWGGSHPDTRRRVVELEKLYHDSDQLFPNATKELTPYPQKVHEAFPIIAGQQREKESRRAKLRTGYQADVSTLLDEVRNTEPIPEIFLSADAFHHVHTVVQIALERELVDQELAHGTLRYRDAVLKAMSTFTLGLKLKDHPHEGPPYQWSINLPDSTEFIVKDRKSLNVDEVLGIPKAEDWCAKKTGTAPFERPEHYVEKLQTEYKQVLTNLGMTTEPRADSIEDWLDAENQDVAPFWELIESRYLKAGETFDRGERLSIIKQFLASFVHGGTTAMFSLVRSRNLSKTIETYEVDIPEPGKLQAAPLGLRAQKKQETKTVKGEIEMSEKEEQFFLKFNYSDRPKPGFDIWEKRDDHTPFMVQNLSAAIRQKTIETYGAVLRVDGGAEVPDTILEYLLSGLLSGGGGQECGSGSVNPFFLSSTCGVGTKVV